MSLATVIVPDQNGESNTSRTGTIQTPALPRRDLHHRRGSGDVTHANIIARAVIHHLNGQPAEALKVLHEIPRDSQTADSWAALGYIQAELGNHSAAALAYSELVLKEPEAAEGWYQWGYCLHKQGRTADALERFEKAAPLKPDWIEIPLARAVCYLHLKNYASACQQADECLRTNPDYVPALFTKAVALHITSALDQAAALYGRILEQEPNSAETLMNLITLGFQQKQYEPLRRYSEQLVALLPEHTLAIEGLATAAFYANDYEKAWEHYTRLVELAPSQVSHWLNLGVTCERREQLPAAISAFTRAREIRADSLFAHTYLGTALWRSKDLTAARECYQQAVAKWPDREDLVLSLEQVLEESNCLEEADTVCAQFCARFPEHEQVWFRLGYVQFLRGLPNFAAQSFAQALRLQPAWPEAEINLALAFYEERRLDEAEPVLVKLLDRDAGNLEAVRGLAAVTLAAGKNERSLELHEILLQRGGPDSDVYYNCGVLAQTLNDPARAADYYRKAIEARNDFAEALLNLGHALTSLGNRDEAKSAWIPALELRPEYSLTYFRKS